MLHGNGFIAAFAGGLAYGAVGGRHGARLVPFVEETGALVSLLVWLAFGAVAVAPALEHLTWQIVVYAVLSLTVIPMAPVAALSEGRDCCPAESTGSTVGSPSVLRSSPTRSETWITAVTASGRPSYGPSSG
jgi:NhaP-type Na+/H+ or K+/H+ antiporter